MALLWLDVGRESGELSLLKLEGLEGLEVPAVAFTMLPKARLDAGS